MPESKRDPVEPPLLLMAKEEDETEAEAEVEFGERAGGVDGIRRERLCVRAMPK